MRADMASVGRPPGTKNPPGHKAGGRVAKSLDRQARALIGNELAGNIMTTFERLGGVEDMIKWAAANRTTFYTAILARLMPAPMRDDPDVVNNTQINVGNMSELEGAMRVAYALNFALNAQKELEERRGELL
jgi:hypothetical protein